MGPVGCVDCTAGAKCEDGAAALRGGNHAADSLSSAMVQPVGSGDGGGAVRHAAVPEVRGAGCGQRRLPDDDVDADSGLVHTIVGTATNVSGVTQAHAQVQGEEVDVFADAGYQGVEKREDTQEIQARRHVALRPGLRCQLDKTHATDVLIDRLEYVKASIRSVCSSGSSAIPKCAIAG